MLVTIQTEGRFSLDDEPIVFPVGTQLIGEWSSEQPNEADTYRIATDAHEWELAADDVVIYSPLPALPPLMQQSLARAHEREAKQAEHQQDLERALTLYSAALAEYTLAGESTFTRAALRLTRGSVLVRLERYDEAIEAFDQVAHACEQAAYDPAQRRFNSTTYLDYAEYAAAALEGLGSAYLLQNAGPAKIRQVIEQLKGINALIKKRYETKVGILLELAALSFEVSEQQEAAAYLAQADRFYSQQFAGYPPYGRITWLAQRLSELKALIQPGATHTIAFTITANTPDEVQTILTTLDQQCIPGLEVTRGVSMVSSGSGRGGVRYTARLRLTVRNKGVAR